MTAKLVYGLLLFMLVSVVVSSVPTPAFADLGYGGGHETITVCKKVNSRFLPYVKVTVPKFVGEKFLSQGGVLPDSNGHCPKGISISDFIAELLSKIFSGHA